MRKINQYIYDKLNLKNVIYFYKLSKLYYLKSLKDSICNLIVQKYLTKEDPLVFYKVEPMVLLEIFSTSQLHISSELELFYAAVDWINYEKIKRSKYMSRLLNLIRLPLLTDEILLRVIKNHELCKNCKTCRDTIDRAVSSKKSRCKNEFENSKQFQNRHHSCEFEGERIVCIGGLGDLNDDATAIQTSSEFRFRQSTFEKVSTTSKMVERRIMSKAAVVGKKIYCFGGYSDCHGFHELNSCEVYCMENDTWLQAADLPFKAHYDYCYCAFMGKVFALGAFSCFSYDPELNKWFEISSMEAKRIYSSCAVFNGEVVVAGGEIHLRDEALKSVESYDHHLNQWSFLPDMNVARVNVGLVAKGNKLYAIGGSSSTPFRDFNHSEVYDAFSNRFAFIFHRETFVSTAYNRSHAFAFGNKILLLLDDEYYVYDTSTNEMKNFKYCFEVLSCSVVRLYKFLK